MINQEDPWDWTKKDIVAPMAAAIQPSQAVIPQGTPDKTEQFLGNQAMTLGANAAAKGIEKGWSAYNAPLTAQATGSMGTNALTGAQMALPNTLASTAPAAESLYAMSAPASVQGGLGLITGAGGSGLGMVAPASAPLGAGIGATLPAVAAEGAGIAAAGSGAAATGAAMAGGEAALAAMGPVGWAIGAGLIAKKLGIF